MNDEYRELFVMYGNEYEHSKLILDLKQPNYKLTEEQKNYLRLLEQAAVYDGRDDEYRRHIEWYNTEDPLTEEDNIPFDEFIKKYTATDESKLKALRENFKFWKLRNEYEKIEGIKILIL